MAHDETPTGLAGARFPSPALLQRVRADASPESVDPGHAARRADIAWRPSGARFRSVGRHGGGRDTSRRAPSGWPFGSRTTADHAPPPLHEPAAPQAAATVLGYGARWAGSGRLCT